MKNYKVLNILLWIAQLLVATFFIGIGIMKLFQPEKLPFPWIHENPTLATIAGVVDLLGGIGLVLPALLRIQPKLTVLAAYGSILLMIVGAAFHIARGESEAIGFNIFVSLILIFIAWGRQKKVPISAKEY